jgi:glycosyltransferase involved in cell wall biosynthesis
MEINLTGYITNQTSYGLVTLNLLKEMDRYCSAINLHSSPQGDCGEFNALVRKKNDIAPMFDICAPSLRIAHQFDMAIGIGLGKRYGYTFSELNRLTPIEKNHLNSLETVIVPTGWQAEVYRQNGVDSRIEVCNAGYNDDIFTPCKYMPPKCVFLSIGKWEVRKQQDQIVTAFHKAFSEQDNVELWLSCDNKFIKEFVDEKKRAYKDLLGDRLKIIGRVQSPFDLARIIQQSYCFVAPSLAEGWNLPLLEAMACGKFSIATNYSGHTEFTNKDTTHLLQPTGLVPAVDNMWFRENSPTNCGEWCSYSEDDLISAMWTVLEDYKSGKILSAPAELMAKKFTWSNAAKTMTSILEEDEDDEYDDQCETDSEGYRPIWGDFDTSKTWTTS